MGIIMRVIDDESNFIPRMGRSVLEPQWGSTAGVATTTDAALVVESAR